MVESLFLSSSFLSQYEGKTPPLAGKLFYPVYLRTYSRFLPEKKRRERWDETVARVVNYSMELYQGASPRQDLINEAEELYDSIFNLKVLPAGRSLWIGGTRSAERFGEANFNCSFVVIDSLEAIGDLFQLLLCGCGVGFRVLPEDVGALPTFSKVKVVNKPYEPQDYRPEGTEYDFERAEDDEGVVASIEIGDSREGWVTALREFLSLSSIRNVPEAIFSINYDWIRPEGSRIETFGGRAPGPAGLMEMFTNLTKVINRSGGRLSPVDVMDMCNFIAKNVIVGGTRRSSQIALGAPTDQEFIDAKKMLWLDRQNLQRTMSNNSIVFKEKPTREQISEVFKGIKVNGEPGFLNLTAMRKRHTTADGTNPCGEIALRSRGFCNLTTVNLTAFIENGEFNYGGAQRAIKLATRVGARATNITVSLPEWDKIQKSDRLLGVSITGIMDTFDRMGWEFDSPEAITLLQLLRAWANIEADHYSFEMRIPRPLLVTCIKPEGSLSQLPTVSSGVSRSYAPYFIRRVRVSAMDPVGKALSQLGVPNEPDQSKSERLVFSFPISSGAKSSANEEPVRRQFERYLTTMKHYTDHNTSTTITISENEWTEIEDLVYDRFDEVVGCSFLPKYTDAYPQMPYEEITREQYEEMMKTFPNLDNLADLVNEFENEEYESDTEATEDKCEAGGACPLR